MVIRNVNAWFLLQQKASLPAHKFVYWLSKKIINIKITRSICDLGALVSAY